MSKVFCKRLKKVLKLLCLCVFNNVLDKLLGACVGFQKLFNLAHSVHDRRVLRPPNSAPIFFHRHSVTSRTIYIAIWRGAETAAFCLLERISSAETL